MAVKIVAVVVLVLHFAGAGIAADGPHLDAAKREAVLAENLSHPKFWDIYYNKKDRQYLQGVWKLKWTWNFLTGKRRGGWLRWSVSGCVTLKPGAAGFT